MNKPISIFLLGGPGSGKDYVLKNIFSRFDLTEVQADQILAGNSYFVENNQNIVINGVADLDKIEMIKSLLEGYEFDYVQVSVTNKVSRIRNSMRNDPLSETKRIEKFIKAEKLAENYDCFKFNNSINLNESSEMEQIMFASQIEQLLERLVAHDLPMVHEKVKEPTGKLKNACWTGYTAVGMKMKNGRKVPNCVPVKEAVQKVEGTNCGNCVFWCHESEQKVDKSELNENGGLKAPNQAYLEKSKHADLISLPGKGTASVKTICEHPDIKDFVTDRMCCAYWNGEGTKREYKGKSPKLDEAFDDFLAEKSGDCGCDSSCDCKSIAPMSFRKFQEATDSVDITPSLKTSRKKGKPNPATDYRSTLAGMPVVTAKMNE